MWRFIPELFEMDAIAADAAARGIGADVTRLRAEYDARIAAVLAEATLERPRDQRPIVGGRRGHHSEHLGPVLAPMQYLQRTYPDAKW
jgi:ring-1,2-phenylacetyl-CoA epoxidase subunit PaaC